MRTVHEYRLHTRQGLIGPVKLETVRDLVDSGVLVADALVSRDDGPFVPLAAYPELVSMVRPGAVGEGAPRYSGDLDVASFMRLMVRLFAERATGLAVVRDATRRKDVYLELGHPVFLTSTIGRERLGEHLITRGRLDPEHLRVALEAQAADEHLGSALVRLGMMTQPEVHEALREQQLLRLVDLCAWEHGRYAFFEGTRYTGPHVDLGLETPELWVRAARGIPERLVLRRLGDVMHQVVSGFDARTVELCSPHLVGEERVAITAFNGERQAVQVVTAESGAHGRRRAVLTVLYLFWELGSLHIRGPVSEPGKT